MNPFTSQRRTLLAIVCGLLSGATPLFGLQCEKPAVPSQGLPVTVTVDQTVTYSDAYLTTGYLAYPSTVPPNCGWPLVVYVHGGPPGSKNNVRAPASAIAARGFAVWAYDVRGQGDAAGLNPLTTGFTFNGPDEKFDLAEEILFARSRFPSLVNPSRTAVAGTSQGAIASWFAAATSEQVLSVPGRGTITFPRIDAVAPHAAVGDVHEVQLPGGTMFITQFAAKLFGNPTLYTPDPATIALWRPFFLADDPAGLQTLWEAEPHRLWGSTLQNTRVPILYQHAYHDGTTPPLRGIERFEELPATTPKRIVLSTGGHQSPANQYEDDFRTELRVRWFDRFLWDIPNEVDLEAPIVRAAMPLDLAQLNDANQSWGQRFDGAFAAADVVPERFFLSPAGALQSNQPGGSGSPTLIDHHVASSYTPALWGFVPQSRLLPNLLNNIPLSERVFTLAPMTQERELSGRIPVSLSVVPHGTRFQLNVKLSARIPGAAADFAICCISKGILGATPEVARRVAIDLPTAACVLPPGTVLKLTIRNHWTFDAPMPAANSTISVPYFQSSITEIRHGNGVEASYIDLPFRTGVRLSLTSPQLSAPRPEGMQFTMEGGLEHAGQPFYLLFSGAGQVPAFPLGNTTLPLDFDIFTGAGRRLVGTGAPGLGGFAGFLDASGRGTASFRWSSLAPLPWADLGPRLTFAAWTTDGFGNSNASNPLDLILR